ncbi:YoaK family protein [Jatrophihabitans sp. DSM 45814]
MAVASPIARRWTVAALLALTGVTGLIDAVSYLRLGRVFVANMTGNVVFIGFSLYPDSGLSALASAVAIAGFVIGALGGGAVGARFDSRPRRWLAGAFFGQALIVAVTGVLTGVGALSLDPRANLVPICLLAVAMGLQNSTVRRLGVPDLTTTVLTLTLTGLSADSGLVGGPGSKPHRRLGSIAAMLAGAAIGAALLHTSPSLVIVLAAAVIAAVSITFWLAPSEPPRKGERSGPDEAP